MEEQSNKQLHEGEWEKDLEWLIADSTKEEELKEVVATSESDNNKSDDERNEEAATQHEMQETAESTEHGKDLSANDDDEDDEDDGLTPDQRKLLQHNTLLNDAEEGDEYDVQLRLQEANKALASEDITEEERERKVLFKSKLVDFEAPPNDFNSSSSSSSDESVGEISRNMDNLELERNKQGVNGKVKKDEKVLVERGGKFELVEAGELDGILPHASNNLANTNHVSLPPIHRRPKSAPVKSVFMQDTYNSVETNKYLSQRTFSYSPEMKELMRKQAVTRAQREKEENARRKAEQEAARQEAEFAWKCWVDRKNTEIKRKKNKEQEEGQRKEMLTEKHPEEAVEAYKMWIKQKQIQSKKERIFIQQQQIEIDEGWYLRQRRDCNRAFRLWVRNKNEAVRKQKENEEKLRRQSLREMRQARKVKKLMTSIREAQQMKYVEYYGYRI